MDLELGRNWEEILYCEDEEALQKVAQRSCGCCIPGSVHHVGWGSEQPGLVEGVHAHDRGVGT